MGDKENVFYRSKKYGLTIVFIVIAAVVIFAATRQQYTSTQQDIEKVVRAQGLFQSVYWELMTQCGSELPAGQKIKALPKNLIIATVNEAGRNVHYAIDGLSQKKNGVKQLPQHAIGQLRQLVELEYWNGGTFGTEGGNLGCTYDVAIMAQRFGYALEYLGVWEKNGFE